MTKPWKLGGLTCAEVDELAPLFVVGALTDDESAAVRDHLAECPETHALVAQLGGTAAYLAELPEPSEPPAALKGRLMAAVEAEATPSKSAASQAAAQHGLLGDRGLQQMCHLAHQLRKVERRHHEPALAE